MTSKKRVLLVFGTRPEAIKMAPVYRALCLRPEAFEPLCCVTAQHRAMLDQVLEAFGIRPDVDLNLMRERQSPAALAAAVLAGVEAVLDDLRPDVVLVHGDTTTSTASALASFYAGIPVGHVEAGLRSGHRDAPFPEEMNRRLTSQITTYHFAPTVAARENLLAEGHDLRSIMVTGNTVVDALQTAMQTLDADEGQRTHAHDCLAAAIGQDWQSGRYVVVTCHRRETYVSGLAQICSALSRLASDFPQIRFIFPVHANPHVREAALRLLGGHRNIVLINPLAYAPFLHLLRHCHLILTDSGGLQEEGPILNKPVLVMRRVTERPEGVAAGGVRLVGVETASIVEGVSRLLSDAKAHQGMASAPNPYGDGTAAARIACFLENALKLSRPH